MFTAHSIDNEGKIIKSESSSDSKFQDDPKADA